MNKKTQYNELSRAGGPLPPADYFEQHKHAPFLRTGFNYDRDQASHETALTCPEPTLTQQHFAEEVDINTIVKRFGLTGEMPTNVRMPTFGDFTETVDYHTAMNAIRLADESFYAMPANVRARFHNSPAEFVEFCSNEKNYQEALDLGLAMPRAVALKTPPGSSGEPPPPRGRKRQTANSCQSAQLHQVIYCAPGTRREAAPKPLNA